MTTRRLLSMALLAGTTLKISAQAVVYPSSYTDNSTGATLGTGDELVVDEDVIIWLSG